MDISLRTAGVILLEPLPEAAAGIGTVYECVTPAIVRSGLDALSNQLGELSVGDEIVALETTVHSGRVRVKFSYAGKTGGGGGGGGATHGWTSVTSGSGGEVLRAKRTKPFGFFSSALLPVPRATRPGIQFEERPFFGHFLALFCL